MQNIEENRVVSREAKHYECVALPTELLRQSRENQRESLFSLPGTHYTKWRFLGGIKRKWSDLAYKNRHRANGMLKGVDIDLDGAFNDGFRLPTGRVHMWLKHFLKWFFKPINETDQDWLDRQW